jgi:hypothetical protein
VVVVARELRGQPDNTPHRNGTDDRLAALTISLRFLARAREEGTTSSPAERAADPAPSDTRAANQIAGLSTPRARQQSLFYFVCSFSVGRCRLMVPTSGQLIVHAAVAHIHAFDNAVA